MEALDPILGVLIALQLRSIARSVANPVLMRWSDPLLWVATGRLAIEGLQLFGSPGTGLGLSYAGRVIAGASGIMFAIFMWLARSGGSRTATSVA